MPRVTAEKVLQTRVGILEAAYVVLQNQGFSGLSTRNVAAAAGVPLSQIQYHFGSKEGMLLALYEHMNEQLLARQTRMFADPDLTFTQKWHLACDYLDTDIDSGYVRVFQELMAAGWSNTDIGDAVRCGVLGWVDLIMAQTDQLVSDKQLDEKIGSREVAALISAVFLGAESAILLGVDESRVPYRQALRRLGALIEMIENEG